MNLDQFRKSADSIVESLPPALFRNLNGGVLILEEKNEEDESLVMGEYVEDPRNGEYYPYLLRIFSGGS